MRLLPRSLPARLALALLAAVGGIALLDHFVFVADARAAARSIEPRVARPEPAQVVLLRPVDGEILLATSLEAVPADAAPVVQILADGRHAVARPAPPIDPARPAAATPAIVLPTALPGRLDARARATFVEVIAGLVAERPVGAARFRTLDFHLTVAELERMLAWVP